MTDSERPAVDLTDEPVVHEGTATTAAEFIAHQRPHLLDEHPEVRTPDIQRNGHTVWKRVGVTLKQQRNYPGKVFLLERLDFQRWEPAKEGDQPIVPHLEPGYAEYRLGYFVVSPKRNKWWWGQSAPFVPAEDWYELIDLAVREGTLLSDAPFPG